MKLWSGVITEKVQESKAFYTSLFGRKIIYEGENGWFVLLALGEAELGFMLPKQDSQHPLFQRPFQGQGMWITIDVEDVAVIYQRFQQQGIPIMLELTDEVWGDRHFVIQDPNGIGVDVVQRINNQAS